MGIVILLGIFTNASGSIILLDPNGVAPVTDFAYRVDGNELTMAEALDSILPHRHIFRGLMSEPIGMLEHRLK